MAIAITLKSYLESHKVHYDTVEHVHTESAWTLMATSTS